MLRPRWTASRRRRRASPSSPAGSSAAGSGGTADGLGAAARIPARRDGRAAGCHSDRDGREPRAGHGCPFLTSDEVGIVRPGWRPPGPPPRQPAAGRVPHAPQRAARRRSRTAAEAARPWPAPGAPPPGRPPRRSPSGARHASAVGTDPPTAMAGEPRAGRGCPSPIATGRPECDNRPSRRRIVLVSAPACAVICRTSVSRPQS